MEISNYMVLFLYDVSLYYKKIIILDSEFLSSLASFFSFYYMGNKKIINKILGIDKDLEIGEAFILPMKENDMEIINKLNDICLNERKVLKIIDEIGTKDVHRINKLVCLFVDFIEEINDIGKSLIRS